MVKRVIVLACIAIGPVLMLPQPASATTTKIVVIVLENKAYSKIVGSPSAPYLTPSSPKGRSSPTTTPSREGAPTTIARSWPEKPP